MLRIGKLLGGAAFALALGVVGASAATANLINSSTNGVGNTADVFAGSYGAFLPSTWSFDKTPLVHVPPGNEPSIYQTPFNHTGLQETRDYFSVGAEDLVGDGATSPTTLTFGGSLIDSLDILWGSIDSYNTLEFFNGSTSLGSFDGNFIAGLLGLSGQTNYEHVALLHFSDIGGATKAVFTSTQAAFEFALAPVPLPAALPLFGTALVGLGLLRRRSRRPSLGDARSAA